MTMTPNEYQLLALRTEKKFRMFVLDEGTHADELSAGLMRDLLGSSDFREINARLFHGLVGGASEQGESLDPFKKAVIYNKPGALDPVNVVEEAGDKLWYISVELAAVGATMEQAMEANIAKLRDRYPDKYTDDLATNRDLDTELATLRRFAGEGNPAEPRPIPPISDVEVLRILKERDEALADVEDFKNEMGKSHDKLKLAEAELAKARAKLDDIAQWAATFNLHIHEANVERMKGEAKTAALKHLRDPGTAPKSPDENRPRNSEYSTKPYTGEIDLDTHPMDRGRDDDEPSGVTVDHNNE